MSEFTIPRVTVLTGHTDAETAYMVEDYPYSFRLRCKIRYWIETCERKGANEGKQRFVSQTSNPKAGGIWNKPKASTYNEIKVLYLDGDGHVQAHGVSFWIDGPADARARHMGVYDALTDVQRKRYDALVSLSYKVNPTSWGEWSETITALAEHIAATGDDPILVNQVWESGGRKRYLSDPAAYVTAARDLLASR